MKGSSSFQTVDSSQSTTNKYPNMQTLSRNFSMIQISDQIPDNL